jgi:hypothetical protein
MHSDKIYLEVGKAILLIQLTDHAFKNVLSLVFPGSEHNDKDVFEKNNKIIEKATLGRLINVLKSRVILNDNFEDILETYLKERNSLIHNWDEIENWENESDALYFTINLQKQAVYFLYVFTGFIRAWMEQVDVDFSSINNKYHELIGLFDEVDTHWKPLINKFIEEEKN